MLRELYIKNMAVIDELRLHFGPGFQVLTGETGAGKSILVEAIGLILGDKAQQTLIRDGAKESIVEAVFDCPQSLKAQKLIQQNDLLGDDPEELIVKRHITKTGKNKIFINHRRAPLSLLNDLAVHLIDFTGQHEQIRLLQGQNDIHALTPFLENPQLLTDYQEQYHKTAELQQKLSTLEKLVQEKHDRLEWIEFQLKDFKELTIESIEEEQQLRQVREGIKSKRLIESFADRCEQVLSGSDQSCSAGLQSLIREYDKTEALQKVYPNLGESLKNVNLQIEDLAFEIAKQNSSTFVDCDLSPDQIESQLHLVEKLKRKFGPELHDVFSKHQELLEEKQLIQNSDEQIDILKKSFNKEFQVLKKQAVQLSQAREAITENLVKSVKKELSYLLMPHVEFQIDVKSAKGESWSDYGVLGIDEVTFLLSPNPGLSLRPLAKVASGGETSRIFLALKQVLATKREGGTLIFDEIDTGISGAAVELVGHKLKSLSEHFQVFSVTHHAPLAALGHQHYKVQKTVESGKTFTKVVELKNQDRIEELARLMGGVEITQKNREFAAEMLSKAQA